MQNLKQNCSFEVTLEVKHAKTRVKQISEEVRNYENCYGDKGDKPKI